MGKNFELTRRTILNQLPRAGFTHLQFRCSECQEESRKPLADFTWQESLASIEMIAPELVCPLCGGPPLIETVGAWSPTNFYRGPR